MLLKGASILVECLKEQKVDTVFGYPGGAVLEIYDELYKHQSEIRHILTCHEQGAAHAADGYARATGKTGVHTRRVGLDRDTNKELLLKHIRQNNDVGTPFKELQQVLPGLDRNQIQVLMRELKKDGKVACRGKTHAAKWYIQK